MHTPSDLDDICRRGVIRVGFQRHTPPFSYATGAGFAPVGYSVDLARRVVAGIARCAATDIEIRAVEVTSSTRAAMLETGDIDIECGSTTITAERRRHVAFSRPIFHTSHRIAMKAGHPRVAGAPLCITGIHGSTSHMALLENAGAFPGLRFLGRTSIGAAFEAFRDETSIDAMVADEVILGALLRRPPTLPASLLDARFGGEHYGFMMRRGDPAFVAAVDRELDIVLGSASFRSLHATWFSHALPGLGFDLGMAISGEMQRLSDGARDLGAIDPSFIPIEG
jgi:glutamate/aspartate transport system substrate-binding protein